MRTSNDPSAPFQRSFGCRCLSGFLAVWLLLLTFAGVSPALHDWLHGGAHRAAEGGYPAPADHGAGKHGVGGHFCGVTSLHTGALCCPPLDLPEWTPLEMAQLPLEPQVLRIADFPVRFQARAPPIEIVV